MASTEELTAVADQNETRPLLPSRSRATVTVPLILLLLMKLCSNMVENQMATFDVKAFQVNGSTCTYVKKTPSSMLTEVVIAMAAAAFLLPTLGGLLSDAFIGSIKVLWIATGLMLCASCFLTALDSFHIACKMSLYLMSWVPVLICMGLGDTVLLSAPLKFAHDSRSRQMLLFLYFVAAAAGETLGNVPPALRYYTGNSYEFLGIIFSVFCVICFYAMRKCSPATLQCLQRVHFEKPTLKRLLRFYLISAGAIPHLTCITLLRVTLYWQQIRFFTHAKGDEDLAASYIGLIGYQTATISLSACAAIAVARGYIPKWLTLQLRIRVGLCLMIITKIPLLLISLLDYNCVMHLEDSSLLTVWAIYFISSFCDGVTNVLTTVAIYELIDCVSEKTAKATFIGIFYTVWGLAILLNGAVLLILQSRGVLSLDTENRMKPKSHFAYATVIGLLVIAIAYWEIISWPLARGHFLAAQENEDEEEDAGTSLLTDEAS